MKRPSKSATLELNDALEASGIKTAAELDAFLLRVKNQVVNGRRVVLVGINPSGEYIWKIERVH